MGKSFAGLIIVVITLFALEWFGAIDIPYIELPDLSTGKQNLMHQTVETVENLG